MANVVINDFSSQTVSQADDSFVIQEAGGTTKKMSKLLLAQSIAYAGYKSYSGLLVSRPSVSTITLIWSQLGIEGIIAGAQNLTLDITASGALGLDTGAESADAWYYIWAIAKTDGTVSALLSESYTAPTMPAGYTLKRLVSYVRNTSGDFVVFLQQDYIWNFTTLVKMKEYTAGFIVETLDCQVYIPALARRISVSLICSTSDAGEPSAHRIDLYTYNSGTYCLKATSTSSTAPTATYTSSSINAEIEASSRFIRYGSVDLVSATAVSTALYISGFQAPL